MIKSDKFNWSDFVRKFKLPQRSHKHPVAEDFSFHFLMSSFYVHMIMFFIRIIFQAINYILKIYLKLSCLWCILFHSKLLLPNPIFLIAGLYD